MRAPLRSLLFSFGLASTLFAQVGAGPRICVLEGSQQGALALRMFDESNVGGPGAVVLSGLAILPIDKTQRTIMADLDTTRARRVERQGILSIELPGGGRVLHYKRNAGTTYGYLLVAADGEVVVLHETNGIGPSGDRDPYFEFVGVAPDGRHVAFATENGAVVLARLDGGFFASTGGPSRTIAVPTMAVAEPQSLTPGASDLFFMTEDDRLWRCPLADLGVAVDVTPVPTGSNDRLDDQFALSGDASTIAFLYGPQRQESIYLLSGQGPARRLPPPPSHYEECGYLPETVGGPFLLLNHTGSRLMYIDAEIRDEIFLLDTTGATPTTHVTGDANFLPYIGVGILPNFAANELLLAVGDPGRFDIFTATTAAPIVSNLTNTGPNPTAPFESGALVPVAGFAAANGAVVSVELLANGMVRNRGLDRTNGTTWSLDHTPRTLPQASSGFGLGSRSVRLAGIENDVLVDAANGAPLLVTPTGIRLSTEVVAADGAFSLLVASDGGSASALLLRAGAGLVPLLIAPRLDQVASTAGGGVVIEFGGALRYFGPGGNDVPLQVAGGSGIVLSGAIL